MRMTLECSGKHFKEMELRSSKNPLLNITPIIGKNEFL
jgi:hypothetical protein